MMKENAKKERKGKQGNEVPSKQVEEDKKGSEGRTEEEWEKVAGNYYKHMMT